MNIFSTLFLASFSLASLSASQIFIGANGNFNSTVADFRNAIGGGNTPGGGGSFGGIRREVNWDGVPNSLSDPNLMPANQFAGRGVIFSTPGTGFINSANSGQPTPALFESFDGPAQGNGTYNFAAFSQQRIFTVLGATTMTVDFVLPGTNTPSFTRAFGSVFVCADTTTACSGSISAIDNLGNTITSAGFSDPSSSGFFFLGILGEGSERFARVDLTFGNSNLGEVHDGQNIVTVMDDFIFAEVGTNAVPEPQAYALIGAGLISLVFLKRR
jgi:hypothetical protein